NACGCSIFDCDAPTGAPVLASKYVTVTIVVLAPEFMIPRPVLHPSAPSLSTNGRLAATVPPAKVLYPVDWRASPAAAATSLTMAATGTPLLMVAVCRPGGGPLTRSPG